MKKFLLSIFAVMLAVFSVQAQEVVTLNGTDVAGKGVSGGGGSIEYTVSPINFNFSSAYGDGELIRFYKSSTLTITGATITKVQFTASASKYGSAVTANSGTVTVSGTTQTWEGSSNSLIITASGSQIRTASITVTYTTTSGGEGGTTEPETPVVETVATPVISAEATTFNEGESLWVAIETETEDAEIYYTLDGTEPSAEDGDIYEGEFEITETTTVKAIAVKEGWNNSAVAEATFTAINPNAVSSSVVASEQGYENAANVETLTFGDVTATFGKGSNSSNAPKYYTSGSAIRAYGGNTITFTGAVGVTITGIKMTFASGEGTNAITADCGTFSTDTWTGASNEVVLTIGGSSGHRRIATITVTYSIEEGAVVIATPSITASTSFVGSTTVEITNNAEGTILYYSTDGVGFDIYEDALNITETTTVYAYAQDAEGNESAVAEATFTKIEVLSIAEAKAAYDNAGANVDVAVDLTGAVVTVNNGQYLFIENETTGINIYNSGADYAEGTKFTAGYILGTSTTYRNMHQLSSVKFYDVETTTVAVEPLEVEIADIAGNYEEYEGRFVKLTGVSIDADKNMTQGDDKYKAYDRFTLEFGAIANCDVTGVVAIYNTGEQLYIKDITYNLSVTDAEYATLFLDFAAVIPAEVEAYTVTEVNTGYATLTQVEGVLPANTGVVVKAAEGDYAFAYSTETATAVDGNLLKGTAAATEIDVDAYVLGNLDGVGLYKAEMTDGIWLNNANKAYLPASEVPVTEQGAASFSFRFEGTTGISEVKGESGNVKAIFDLTGRRVEAISAPGIYIVNGKKVLVK